MEMSMSMHMNPNAKQRFQTQNLPSINPRKPTISCQFMQNKTNTNFYQLLSLPSQSVGVDEIKKAYRSMALHYHPDLCTSPLTKDESTRKFIEIRNAYETLSDPKSRQIYDCELGLNESRKVWEKQLHGLRRRCDARMEKRRYEEFM